MKRPRVCAQCGCGLDFGVRMFCSATCSLLHKARRQPDGCLVWTGNRDPEGYGGFVLNGRRVKAHRAAYELFVGPIPTGLVVDHLCRNPSCVEPTHLEPVTVRENTLRGVSLAAQFARATHCINGHEFTEENTRRHKGTRHCRACCRERDQRSRRAS